MCDRIGLWHVMLSERESGLICGYSQAAAKNLASMGLGFDNAAQYFNSMPDKDLREHCKIFDVEDVLDMADLRSITTQFFKNCEREECTDIVIAPKMRDVLDAMRPVPKGMPTYLCLCGDWNG